MRKAKANWLRSECATVIADLRRVVQESETLATAVRSGTVTPAAWAARLGEFSRTASECLARAVILQVELTELHKHPDDNPSINAEVAKAIELLKQLVPLARQSAETAEANAAKARRDAKA